MTKYHNIKISNNAHQKLIHVLMDKQTLTEEQVIEFLIDHYLNAEKPSEQAPQSLIKLLADVFNAAEIIDQFFESTKHLRSAEENRKLSSFLKLMSRFKSETFKIMEKEVLLDTSEN